MNFFELPLVGQLVVVGACLVAVVVAGVAALGNQINKIDKARHHHAESVVGVAAWKAGSKGPIQE